jgi:hypothetical protein
MKTNSAFINEYKLYDDVFDCIESCQKEATLALYHYNNTAKQMKMKAFFEGVDVDILMEAENEGFLTKIGNKVLQLLTTIANFIRGITEKITGNVKGMKSDEERVTKIITEHPELKKQVCKGLKEEWFQYKDVAKYEKDIAGLINMLEKEQIDHQTFMDKVKKASEDFTSSAKSIINVGTSIAGLIKIVPNVHHACKEAKESVSEMSGLVETFKGNVEKNYADHDQNKVTSIFNALSQAVGLTTKECSDRVAGQSWISNTFHNFANSKVGGVLHIDDDSRDMRHVDAYIKYKDKQDKKDIENAYDAAKEEDKVRTDRRAAIDMKISDEEYERKQRRDSDQRRRREDIDAKLSAEKYEKDQRAKLGLTNPKPKNNQQNNNQQNKNNKKNKNKKK